MNCPYCNALLPKHKHFCEVITGVKLEKEIKVKYFDDKQHTIIKYPLNNKE